MSRVRVPSIALCVHPMTTLEAIILGIIQGITEFLPVSSSGHLQLAQSLLGFEHLDSYIVFNLVCHLGTLLAIFCIFFQQIREALFVDRVRFLQIVIAILPLFPLLMIMKPIKAIFSQPEYLGYFFMLTALLLYLGIRFSRQVPEVKLLQTRWRDALIIGVFQAIAILPGVSRSGSTISAGRILGWSKQEAITFSFLLAIPTILGGMTLEMLQIARGASESALPAVGFWQYAAGFITSFGVGYLALQMLKTIAGKDKFIYFVWYCLFIGIFSLIYFR